MKEAEKHVRPRVIARFFRRTLMGERMNIGAYMWAAQRLTGIGLVFYLVLHMYTLAGIWNGAEYFDRVMEAMESGPIKVLEVILIGVAFFHALNGLRLILTNSFVGLDQQMLAYGVTAATIIVVLLSIPAVF
jgi:succinate dehydrogenase / fumarate reductase cytochrome b subunit